MHLVITDSGLGGLAVCARLERALREDTRRGPARLTYFNAWPEQDRGYNSLPDVPARARVFDRALDRMRGMQPDAIVIACNTLSILYEQTAFARDAGVSVRGIIDAGVQLFAGALEEHPASSLVILGTRTTVESGVHRDQLVQRGVDPSRIAGTACHGLATAIEGGPDSGETEALIGRCANAAAEAAPRGSPLLAALCCTHFGFVDDAIRRTLAARAKRPVITLDPNVRLADEVLDAFGVPQRADDSPGVTVEMISKVEVSPAQQRAIGDIVERVSPATAAALRSYRHVPDLF